MRPVRVETYVTEREAQARLAQVSADHKPQHSNSRQWVYWSGRTKSWLTVERRGGMFVVSFYTNCPCNT